MTRALVLRPQPGNAATCARLCALGIAAQAVPLFHVVPQMWEPPPAAAFDALLLTSANAPRHAGPALQHYAGLPVVAVGEATAAAARAAGLTVAAVGNSDAAGALAAAGVQRALHLAGAHRIALPGVTAVTVYRSDILPVGEAEIDARLGGVALLHSARAAQRLAELVPSADRAAFSLAALSDAVAFAAGSGWRTVAVAEHPRDTAIVALAAAMIDRVATGADKPGA